MIWKNGKKYKHRKEWAFLTKHQIEDLVFKEIVWMRPYKKVSMQPCTFVAITGLPVDAASSRTLLIPS